MDFVHKTWKFNTASEKKLLSRNVTHLLSHQLNKNKFEVVFEGYLDSFNSSSEQPDVVIYSKEKKLTPVIAIEFCKADEMVEMQLLGKHLVSHYSLCEFFIFNYETKKWLMMNKRGDAISDSYSLLLSIDLKKMVNLFPYDVISNNLSQQFV